MPATLDASCPARKDDAITSPRRLYSSEQIEVGFDPRRCIHSERCIHGLPAVFDPGARPWIAPDRAAADEVAAAVARCPTGALTFRRLDGGPDETAPDRNEIRVTPDGPLYASGDLRIERPDGTVTHETRAALCRCGASRNKPYCDNSHRDAGFEAPATLGAGRLVVAESEHPWLDVKMVPGGPLKLSGPATLRCDDDGEGVAGHRGALCRCGASSSKPFCDGTHNRIRFDEES